jgi:hypothetical protein
MTDQASWLNGFTMPTGLTVIDRWAPPRTTRRTGRPHVIHNCGWCIKQATLRDAGKKHQPFEACPHLNWTPPPPPSATIPAAERFELVEIRVLGRRRVSWRHLGYHATKEAVEACASASKS